MITIARITKRFGRVIALDDVTLSVRSGEKVAFVGSNGSGKTTLLRALLGLVRFDGRITVAGADVAREPEIALRSVAYIPQIAPPIEAPVAEVVRAASALRGLPQERTWARAAHLGLDVDLARGKRFRDLSGGMKQKLLAAMALAAEAPILVCDEPTANLDGKARGAFFELLAERPRSGIVVLCSHRVEEVRALVDRVVELSEGRVARDIPVADVLAELRAFRIEVALDDGASQAAVVLRARGFTPAGPRRLALEVSQTEKIAVVSRLLEDHGAAISDLSVTPLDDLTNAQRAPAPRNHTARPALRVVAS